jgi:hypothetical protein
LRRKRFSIWSSFSLILFYLLTVLPAVFVEHFFGRASVRVPFFPVYSKVHVH